jgi:hypothetical protein
MTSVARSRALCSCTGRQPAPKKRNGRATAPARPLRAQSTPTRKLVRPQPQPQERCFRHSAASAEDRAPEDNSAPAKESIAGAGVASAQAALSANSPALQAMMAYVAASSGPFVINARILQEINTYLAEDLDLVRMFARASSVSDLLALQREQFATAMRQATAWRALTRQALTHAAWPTMGAWLDASFVNSRGIEPRPELDVRP